MSNFRRFLMIKNESVEPVQTCCVYTTTGASQSVKLINRKQYAKKITLEDGTDVPITGTGVLNYTFADAGEHKVAIKLKKNISSFYECFRDCSGLTSIPDNLFAANTAVTDFNSCFYQCSELTSIPSNLFSTNTAVTDFSYCFDGCSGLTSIPENLFANCPNVTGFNQCFYHCSGLTGSIPYNLFANCPNVTGFSFCFDGCRRLTGTCPVDNDGTPIYNRSGEGKEGYAIVTDYSYCFYNCTGLTDYNSIPSDWK